MRVALFHNRYTYQSGEDRVFELQLDTLRQLGHDVATLERDNATVFKGRHPLAVLQAGWSAPDNRQSYRAVRRILAQHDAQVGHVHNWFPLLSPSIFEAHYDQKVPVVQTLHNYRLTCAAGTLRRNGQPCTLCLEGDRQPAMTYRCYQGSRMQTFVWKRTVDQSWDDGTFTEMVSAYIAPSQEVKRTHVLAGVPDSLIHVIHNASEDPCHDRAPSPLRAEDGAIFVGRLVPEKGVDVMLAAWAVMPKTIPLRIIGTGPAERALMAQASTMPHVRFLGTMGHDQVLAEIEKSAMLILPSTWPEPFGLGVIEAMSVARPIVASNIGGPAELFSDGVEGRLVPPSDPDALASAVTELLADESRLTQMGEAARTRYLASYTPQAHIRQVLDLYNTLQPA